MLCAVKQSIKSSLTSTSSVMSIRNHGTFGSCSKKIMFIKVFKTTVLNCFGYIGLGKRPVMFRNDSHWAVIRKTAGCNGRCQYISTVVYVHMIESQFRFWACNLTYQLIESQQDQVILYCVLGAFYQIHIDISQHVDVGCKIQNVFNFRNNFSICSNCISRWSINGANQKRYILVA